MTVAVLLLTCDRLDLTRATLESFARQNPDARERFLLLHADDASTDPAALQALTAAHGFETVVAHATRRGVRALRAAGVAVAAARHADWVLVLENDWEWARPFPWALFTRLVDEHPEVYHLRLYGAYKERGQRNRCWAVHMGRGRAPVTWAPLRGLPEPVEVAAIHWGAPPAVTRMKELRSLCVAPMGTGYDGSGDVHEMHASGRLTVQVARVVENVVFHIGFTKTPGPGHRRPWAARAPRPATWSRPAPVPRRVGAAEREALRRRRPDRYTPEWQATRAKYQAGSARCLDLALARGPRPASLLDLGCGDGSVVRRAREFGLDAIGVDLTVPADTAFRQADLRAPLDLGRTFDWVLCWEVAEHLPEAAADILVGTIARHLAPGGTLLFTAAHPGQGGDGHLNEQPAVYWRDRLQAAGLTVDPVATHALAAQWTAEARSTPWYGANLQVFHAPGVRATVPRPRIAITMRTADRSPHPNYVGGTVARLLAQGVDPAAIHVCPTAPEIGWLEKELRGAPVTLHTPETRRTPNENGLAQIRVLDPTRYDWVLLLEDDLGFCADFLGSVQRWLLKANRPDRNVYRLFTFRNRPPSSRKVYAYDMPLKNMCGTQAVLLRMADALDFLEWGDKNLETWGGFRGNPRIAFDKLMAAWALARWPDRPGVVSHPMFVQHVGDVSSLHPAAIRMDRQFAGTTWRFAPEEATA